MKTLFIIDRVELKYFEFNDLVTNFSLIKELLERGQDVHITTIDKLGLEGGIAFAHCYKAFCERENIFYDKTAVRSEIEDFSLVMFRPDPPVDLDYINATYVFDFVDRNKTVILNDPAAIRDFNEKLHAVLFNDLMPPNIVTSSKSDIMTFLNEHGEIVLKPLNGCMGAGVMYLRDGDKNTNSIINSVTNKQTTLVMVQKYIPAHGDKRVLFLGGEVLDVCVQKLPGNDDFKFNHHCDSSLAKAVLTDSERAAFEPVARRLNEMGLPFAGLDVMNGQIIEINVTSPCYFIREINNHFGIRLEKKIVDFILESCKVRTCNQ
ncbi:MAG: hypothetical protein LBJ74_02085 [Heliobacteriaceae bacterium]|jgi:glutathione synthase|nr:hypothetical protein [Heliobacteriaceae bacterium]